MAIKTEIQSLEDMALLEALCSTNDDDTCLYNEFVRRFLPELESECKNICKKRKLDIHIGKQIAHETFEKLRKYKSFKSDQLKVTSDHHGILIYLYRICRNLFIDWHNKEKRSKDGYVNKSYFDGILEQIVIPDTVDVLQWKRDVAVKLFNKLNEKEKAVVIADIEHKKHFRYLPDEINEKLAYSLNVQKSTIRKIRERAIEKIVKAINEINQQ